MCTSSIPSTTSISSTTSQAERKEQRESLGLAEIAIQKPTNIEKSVVVREISRMGPQEEEMKRILPALSESAAQSVRIAEDKWKEVETLSRSRTVSVQDIEPYKPEKISYFPPGSPMYESLVSTTKASLMKVINEILPVCVESHRERKTECNVDIFEIERGFIVDEEICSAASRFLRERYAIAASFSEKESGVHAMYYDGTYNRRKVSLEWEKDNPVLARLIEVFPNRFLTPAEEKNKLYADLILTITHGVDRDLENLVFEKGADVNEEDSNGRTPIYFVQVPQTITWLVQLGAKINHQDKRGDTPLHFATSFNNDMNTSFLEALVENGARLDIKNKEGLTPQDYAECRAYRQFFIEQGKK